MSRDPDEDGFLARWSRRKRDGEPDQTDAIPDDPPPEKKEERSDEEILAELNLPDPETLGPGDDFASYLKAPIPDRIRAKALRRLWKSDPIFGHLDGLNEYDLDYTKGSVPIGALKTAYEVGRGFLKDTASEETEEVAQSDTIETHENKGLEEQPEDVVAQIEPNIAEEALDAEPQPEEEHSDVSRTRRRMAFRFEDTIE